MNPIILKKNHIINNIQNKKNFLITKNMSVTSLLLVLNDLGWLIKANNIFLNTCNKTLWYNSNPNSPLIWAPKKYPKRLPKILKNIEYTIWIINYKNRVICIKAKSPRPSPYRTLICLKPKPKKLYHSQKH